MAENDGQERTEEATGRRRQQAREKGQVPRSRELASVAVLVVGAIALMVFGDWIVDHLMEIMQRFFTLERREVFDIHILTRLASDALLHLMLPVIWVLGVLFLAGFLGASGLGGSLFHGKRRVQNCRR